MQVFRVEGCEATNPLFDELNPNDIPEKIDTARGTFCVLERLTLEHCYPCGVVTPTPDEIL